MLRWNCRNEVDGVGTIVSLAQVDWCYVGKKTMSFSTKEK